MFASIIYKHWSSFLTQENFEGVSDPDFEKYCRDDSRFAVSREERGRILSPLTPWRVSPFHSTRPDTPRVDGEGTREGKGMIVDQMCEREHCKHADQYSRTPGSLDTLLLADHCHDPERIVEMWFETFARDLRASPTLEWIYVDSCGNCRSLKSLERTPLSDACLNNFLTAFTKRLRGPPPLYRDERSDVVLIKRDVSIMNWEKFLPLVYRLLALFAMRNILIFFYARTIAQNISTWYIFTLFNITQLCVSIKKILFGKI